MYLFLINLALTATKVMFKLFISPFNPLLYLQHTMWSINNVAARHPLETCQWFYGQKDQINGIFVALLLVEGLEIPLIWYIVLETLYGGLPAGLFHLHY